MLSDPVAEAVVGLAHNPEFKVVWKYFNEQADWIKGAILDPATDMATREVLVRVHEVFLQEVVNLPERSIKQLDKPTTGQAKAPVQE